MKKKLVLVVLCFIVFVSGLYSQIGLKLGLSMGGVGVYTDLSDVSKDTSQSNFGYHFGVFSIVHLKEYYFRPELVFNTLSVTEPDEGFDISITKIGAPLLMGYKILDNINLFLGPEVYFNKISNLTKLSRPAEFGLSLHAGITYKFFEVFGVDLKYEYALSSNSIVFYKTLDGKSKTVDTAMSQISLSGYFIFN